MKTLDLLPDDPVLVNAINAYNLINNNKFEENDINNIDSKYYKCEDFFAINNTQSFNILHTYLNGLNSHADN